MKRHSADLVSFSFGFIFLAIAGWWAVDRFVKIDWSIPYGGWVAAGALVLLGLLGVVASLRGDRRATDPANAIGTGPQPPSGPQPPFDPGPPSGLVPRDDATADNATGGHFTDGDSGASQPYGDATVAGSVAPDAAGAPPRTGPADTESTEPDQHA